MVGFLQPAPVLDRNVKAVRFGNRIGADEVVAVANIYACAGLVATLTKSRGKAEKDLYSFIGVAKFDEVVALKNEDRLLFALVAPAAIELLSFDNGYSAARRLAKESGLLNPFAAAECLDKISLLGGKVLSVAPMAAEPIEMTINNMLRSMLNIDEDLLAPKTIHDPDSEELVVAFVAVECIKLTWQTEFSDLGSAPFTTESGDVIRASFCGDDDAASRSLLYLRGTVCRAVNIPAKPKNGSTRSMVLVLPDDGRTVTEAFDDIAAMFQSKKRWETKDVDVMFPKLEVVFGPRDVKPWIETAAPDIFDPSREPFDAVLPTEKLGTPAYVSKMVHFAALQVDHTGAEAKAVTVAPVVVYRSMTPASPPPLRFHCKKDFGVIIVEGDLRGDFKVEFLAKIGGNSVLRA